LELESRKGDRRHERPVVTRDHEIAHEIERGADMSLIGVILTLVVVGIVLWLINNYVPMDSKIKTILNVVVVVVVVIWLLQSFGVLGSLRDLRIR
jgi:Flp pilus assembly protein TadB